MAEKATLEISEIFYSIQGESLFAGKPTIFIRTSKCHLKCVWCDTRHANRNGEWMSIAQILSHIKQYKTRYVCLTGGEPLCQEESIPLMEKLLARDYIVSLETGGSYSVAQVPQSVIKIIDIKCPDSGECDKMAWENLELACPSDQLKFVIASKKDFDWAQAITKKHKLNHKCVVLYVPAFGWIKPRELADWILEAGAPVTLQLQMHKAIWGPETQSV